VLPCVRLAPAPPQSARPRGFRLRSPRARRGPAGRGRGDEAAVEPDSHFEWVSPDEHARLPFSPARADALALAAEWDLCVAGDGLAHLQQGGLDAAFIPLVQARAARGPRPLAVRPGRDAASCFAPSVHRRGMECDSSGANSSMHACASVVWMGCYAARDAAVAVCANAAGLAPRVA